MWLSGKLLILFNLLFTLFCFGQTSFNWEEFVKKAEKYYNSLEKVGIQNFSSLITSDTYLNYLKTNNYDSTFYYPLKFIWTNQEKVYYILQPHPNMNNEEKRKKDLIEIQAVKNQFKGFLLDWQNFMFYTPFVDIPKNPTIKVGKDTIQVSYVSGEGDLQAKVKKLFLPSGLLLKVTVTSKNNKVITTPIFTDREGKWLCLGWDSQIFVNGQVTSGTATRLEVYKVNKYFFFKNLTKSISFSQKLERWVVKSIINKIVCQILFVDHLFRRRKKSNEIMGKHYRRNYSS